ncbi:unannotated protein [freshwater metagenome]|uniref:Unannotated protein n=1 Tax=freshwater metagenome TaxID=449393 RepID=A0A6J5YDJ8_9ZZZZ
MDSTAERVTPSGSVSFKEAGAGEESAVPVLTNNNGNCEKPVEVIGCEVASSPFASRNPTPVDVIVGTFWVGSPPVDSAVAIGIP